MITQIDFPLSFAPSTGVDGTSGTIGFVASLARVRAWAKQLAREATGAELDVDGG